MSAPYATPARGDVEALAERIIERCREHAAAICESRSDSLFEMSEQKNGAGLSAALEAKKCASAIRFALADRVADICTSVFTSEEKAREMLLGRVAALTAERDALAQRVAACEADAALWQAFASRAVMCVGEDGEVQVSAVVIGDEYIDPVHSLQSATDDEKDVLDGEIIDGVGVGSIADPARIARICAGEWDIDIRATQTTEAM